MIEAIESAYYRLPLEPMGDAGHGAIDSEELIVVTIRAGGVTGLGYAYTIGRGGHAIKALLDHDLAPLLIGHDERNIEQLWRTMWGRLLFVGRGGLAAFAIAAVDIALWDLRGMQESQPLYRMIGGTARGIPAYGSGVDLPKPIEELIRQVEGFVARGFKAVKMKIGRPDFADDVARTKAVRSAIGDQVDLMIDVNMAWSMDQALIRGKELEAYAPVWLEEPLIPEDVRGHRRLADELETPIAVGESLHSEHEFAQYIASGAIEVVQIDPITNGGITPVVRILAMADQAGLPTSSHYADELSAHLLCASRRPIYLEKHAFALDPYLEEPQHVVDGQVRPTEAPGHGMRFRRDMLKPFKR